MKECPSCKIKINTSRIKCPLCKSILVNSKDKSQNFTLQEFPKLNEKKKSMSMFSKILILITVLSITVSLLVNLFYLSNGKITSLWGVSAALGVLALVSLVNGCIRDYLHFHFNFPIFLAILVFLSGSLEYLHKLGSNLYNIILSDIFQVVPFTNFYTLLFVFPFLCTLGVLVLAIRSLVIRTTFKNDMIYIFGLAFLCIITYIIFTSINIFTKTELSFYLGCMVVCAFSILSLFVLVPKQTTIQLAKLFSI
jgi:hypothetical protein